MTTRRLLARLLAVLVLASATSAIAPGCRDAQPPAAAAVEYFCPMHPQIVRDRAGECPICGMNLEKRDPAPTGSPHAEHGAPPPSGRIAVTIPPERRELLGVRTEEVREQELTRDVSTVGRVTVDERRIHHQHAKFEGYVDRLHVNFTGQLVKQGAPLLAIYSPELVATQQEYLAVYRAQVRLGSSPIESVSRGATDLLEAARERLLLWDIRPQDIARLEKSGEVRRSLDLHAERGGYVVEKTAVHGMRITPADVLFKVADLSHLWVMADLYEGDLSSVRIGQAAEVKAIHAPGRSWHGPVTWIAPTVDEQARTIKVRVEIDNPGDVLKPDMYADVVLRGRPHRALVIPESAVVETGKKRLAFVDRGEGRYEPREITVGARTGSVYEVVSGVSAGDRVVTSANFLLDSESSLKAAVSAFSSPSAKQ
jgi:membrane fusion protein, copper/silver efflux system